MMEESIKLGNQIEIVGFNEVSRMEMEVLKKMIGNYAKVMSEKNTNFINLKITMAKEQENFNFIADMKADKDFNAEESGNNMFFTLDKTLKKIVEQL